MDLLQVNDDMRRGRSANRQQATGMQDDYVCKCIAGGWEMPFSIFNIWISVVCALLSVPQLTAIPCAHARRRPKGRAAEQAERLAVTLAARTRRAARWRGFALP
jgi:hypothetical protein